MRSMNNLAGVSLRAAFVFIVSVTGVSAQETCPTLVNGGFELGSFAGWTTTAGPYQDRNYLPMVFPVSPFGSFQAKLTAGPVPAATIESFLGVTTGFFSGQKMTGGAAIKKTFQGNQGDIVHVNFYWSGQDVAGARGAPFNDTGYLTITQSSFSMAAVFPLADIATVGNGHDFSVPFLGSHPGKGVGSSKGYQTFVWTLPSTQTYTIGFVSFNQTDNAFPSDLLVDNLICTPDPQSGPGQVLPSVPREQQKLDGSSGH